MKLYGMLQVQNAKQYTDEVTAWHTRSTATAVILHYHPFGHPDSANLLAGVLYIIRSFRHHVLVMIPTSVQKKLGASPKPQGVVCFSWWIQGDRERSH